MRRDLLPLLLLALCLLPYAGAGTFCNDEFTAMSHAVRILHGEVPYRDFFEFIPPLTLYGLAGAYALWGASLATTHRLAAVIIFVSGVMMTRLARRLGLEGGFAWLPAFGLAAGLYGHWAIYSHHWAVLPLELGALELAIVGVQKRQNWPWLGAGILSGMAIFTLQTDGLAMWLALALGGLLEAVNFGALGLLLLGAALPCVAWGTVLYSQQALAFAWQDLFIWPFTQYRIQGGINDIRFGGDLMLSLTPAQLSPQWLGRAFHMGFTYLAVLVGPLLALVLRPHPAGYNLLALWAAISFLAAISGRADYVHVSEYSVPGLLIWVLSGAHYAKQTNARPIRYLFAVFIAAFALTGLLMLASAIHKSPERWCHPIDPDANLRNAPVMRFLSDRARPGDRMVAMPYGGYFYFYGPPPASRFTVMLNREQGYGAPGEFDAFWAEIAARHPRFIVIAPYPWTRWEEAIDLYARHLPPGYREVAQLASPEFGPGWPTTVYEAQDAQ